MICGYCVNWRCDDPLHLTGHCALYRTEQFHGDLADACTKYKTIFALDNLKQFGEKEGNTND